MMNRQKRGAAPVAAATAIVLTGLLAATGCSRAAAPGTAEVAVIPLEGEIGGVAARAFTRALEDAMEDRPRFLLVEMDAWGQDLEAAREIASRLERVPRETEVVGFLTGRAGGGAALAALACDHLTLAPGARLGECEGIASPALAAEMAALARRQGFPPALAAAMGGSREAVFYVRIEDDSGAPLERLISESDLSGWPAARMRRIIARETVVERGEILTLEPAAARRYGVTRLLPATRHELVMELENRVRGPLTVREAGGGAVTSLEQILAWAARNGLLPFFLFAGLLGIFVEIYHPGLVFPGVLGILLIAIALSGGHMAGLTSALDIALIAAGVVLILLEAFVIPGFGITGILGILALLVGAFLAFQQSPWPATAAEAAQWRSGAKTFAIGLVAMLAAFGLIARFLPRSPLLKRLVHTASQRVEDGYTVASASRVALLGRTGVAATDLRPAGKVVIADEVLDAVSEGDFIERGAPIEVAETSENRLVVKRIGPARARA